MVKRGDTIDFICSTIVSGKGVPFAWSPAIHMEGGSGALAQWNAQKDFSTEYRARRLNPWEKFAQVLLETNELKCNVLLSWYIKGSTDKSHRIAHGKFKEEWLRGMVALGFPS